MLRISQLKLSVTHDEVELISKIQKLLQVSQNQIGKIEIRKQSLDARKKPDLYYIYTVDVEVKEEAAVWKKVQKKKTAEKIEIAKRKTYVFPEEGSETLTESPIVVGCGPAGLFCAYFLADNGYKPIIIERGAPVEERQKDVEEFWQTGRLKPDSNVQFGEGGAGTFSDGKLNTLVKDPMERIHKVLEIFVKHGAPEEILYVNKPHIGTDILCDVIKSMRNYIVEKGGTFCFHTKMTDLLVDENRKITGIAVLHQGEEKILASKNVILALGHSARDSFQMLYERKLPMEAKPFAVGLRVEHPQELINQSQYGQNYPSVLPAAAYKLTAKTTSGRGVYSFCMCPGGHVVNASSEDGMLAVNGMSYHARDSRNANSAIIVTVSPEDYGMEMENPLAGVTFQRKLERAAYETGNGKIPVQRYGEFQKKVLDIPEKAEHPELDSIFEGHEPCVKGMHVSADLTKVFPKEINQAFVEGMEDFDKKIKGFAHPQTLLLGVESRTSSPIRILRDENLESEIKGIYPCGEGAGYAGGITSAAVDGIKIAEKIRQKYRKIDTSVAD